MKSTITALAGRARPQRKPTPPSGSRWRVAARGLMRAALVIHAPRPEEATGGAAMGHVANLLGIATAETLRKWVRQDQIDQGSRPGAVSYTHLRAHETDSYL